MNKNISVWRGNQTPPTNNHIWIKEDNNIYIHNGIDWEIKGQQDNIDLSQLINSAKIHQTNIIDTDTDSLAENCRNPNVYAVQMVPDE